MPSLWALASVLGHRGEGRGERLAGLLDLFFTMREGYVDLLSGLDDAALQEGPGEGGVERHVRRQRRAIVGDGLVGEVDLEDGRFAGDLGREARRAGGLVEGRLDPVARPEETLVRPGLSQLRERGQSGRTGDGIAVERPRLLDLFARARLVRRQMAHDLLAPDHGGQREAAAD